MRPPLQPVHDFERAIANRTWGLRLMASWRIAASIRLFEFFRGGNDFRQVADGDGGLLHAACRSPGRNGRDPSQDDAPFGNFGVGRAEDEVLLCADLVKIMPGWMRLMGACRVSGSWKSVSEWASHVTGCATFLPFRFLLFLHAAVDLLPKWEPFTGKVPK